MRIALTGASGFVGQSVSRELRARGVKVCAVGRSVDRLSAKLDAGEVVTMDVMAPPSDPFKVLGAPDLMIHLAWGGLPNYQSPYHVETELPAQFAFLRSCIEHGLKRLVITGTCYEYGLIPGELTEDLPVQPCTQYGSAKNLLRQRLSNLHQQYDFELAWLRLFYLFGKGQSESSLYSMLQAAISRGDTSFDMSGGEQVRDFLPVGEAARLIVDVALRYGACGVFNICSGVPIAIRQLVQSWIEAAGAKLIMNLGSLPYSPLEPMVCWGSRDKLNSILRNLP